MKSPRHRRRKAHPATATPPPGETGRTQAAVGPTIRPPRPRPRLMILSSVLFSLWLILLIALAANAL